MTLEQEETLSVRSDADIVKVRQATRGHAQAIGFSLVDQTKLVTAASEIARNALTHGGGGEVHIEVLREGDRRGVRLTFVDQGPGISDVETALQDRFSTAGGLGLGLGGARRLMDEFDIHSEPGEGTRVVMTRWR